VLFSLGKIFLILAAPGNFLTLLLGLGVLLLGVTRRRRGFGLVVLGTLGFAAIALLPVGDWLLVPLENRFEKPPALPSDITGIVVLGGSVNKPVSDARRQTTIDQAAERLSEALALAQRYPSARIVVSGGDRYLFANPSPEAVIMANFFREHGIDPARLTLERRSRTTYENAVLSYEAVAPKPEETWVLVTSASHLPRAVGCFRHVGWSVIPYPAGYRTTGQFPIFGEVSLLEHLTLANTAMREWLGLVAYRVLGRTDALLPGPG
jgi:uncharacterized SAM-binding protein YcdF (DUF218 family)